MEKDLRNSLSLSSSQYDLTALQLLKSEQGTNSQQQQTAGTNAWRRFSNGGKPFFSDHEFMTSRLQSLSAGDSSKSPKDKHLMFYQCHVNP